MRNVTLPRPSAAPTPAAPAPARLLHSFDLFDTLLTRALWRPEDAFLLLGQRLARAGLLDIDPDAFAALRAEAEAALRRDRQQEEVALPAIHAALAPALGWGPAQREAAIALEIATEEALVRPVAPNAVHLARLVAEGAEVAVVSDTTLDRAALARLLRQAGIAVPERRIFASAMEGATKRTGRLFGVVATATGIAPARIHHRGDHPEADVAMPRRSGIAAEQDRRVAPTRHEAALHAATAAHPPLLRSLLAGAARAARLGAETEGDHARVLREVGTGVAGPLLTGFVLWVLAEARAARVARLHFVARDGQVLLRIAEVLLAQLGWPIECRYLLGSRQAWHLPALGEVDAAALTWLAADAGREPLGGVLARAELDPADIAAALARHGLGALDRPAPAERLRALLLDAEVAPRIRAAAEARRHAALGYLRQEGVLDDGTAMMVDLGWHGRLQRSLQRLVELAPGSGTPTRVTGLYLALNSRPAGIAPARMRAFLDAPTAPALLNPVLLELFCAADHGTVRGYREGAPGRFEAELAAPRDTGALDWGLPALQDGILAFAREAAAAMALAEAPPEAWIALLRDGGLAACDTFRREPDAAEAEAFGIFPHADGQAHLAWTECAPRIGAGLRLRLGLGLRAPGYAGHWPEASIRRGGGRMATAIFAVKRLRRRLARATRLSRPRRGTPGSA